MPSEKETLSVRIPPEQVREIESLADEKGLSKSDAARRIIRQGIQLEKKDLAVVSTQQDAIPDGGTIGERLENIEDHQTGIEAQNRDLMRFMLALALSLIWVAVDATVGLSDPVILITGPLVVVALLVTCYPLLRGIWSDNDE